MVKILVVKIPVVRIPVVKISVVKERREMVDLVDSLEKSVRIAKPQKK